MYYLDEYKHCPNLLWENYLRQRARGVQERYLSLGDDTIYQHKYINFEKLINFIDGDLIENDHDRSITSRGNMGLNRSTL